MGKEMGKEMSKEMYQVIDGQGRLVNDLPEIKPETVIELFRWMVLTRTLDRKLTKLSFQGRTGNYYQNEGMEAHCAAALALGGNDWVFPSYRELGVWLTRGISLESVIRFWKKIPTNGWDTKGKNIARINATIGTHLPHATGYAYASRAFGRNQVAMAVFGDGATSESDFHAALNFAGVWKTPTIFFCQNNLWAEETPLRKQTASETLAQKAVAYGIKGVSVDGMDPLAVYKVVADAAERGRNGGGATLIEMHTYRFGAHFMAAFDPRPKEEIEEFKRRDWFIRMPLFMVNQGYANEAELQSIQDEAALAVDDAVATVEAELEGFSPPREYIVRNVFEKIPAGLLEDFKNRESMNGRNEVDITVDELWKIDRAETIPVATETASMNLSQALNAAMHQAMEKYSEMIVLGEDVALVGGQFRVCKGLLDKYGEERVIDTPLCETGIIGTAVGMAMAGARVVAEIMFAGFVYPAIDQIVGHVARTRYRYGGVFNMPMVIRMGGAGGFRSFEFHSDTPEGILLNTPGLIVVMPSSPIRAKGLMAAAIQSNDPVIFIEPLVLYNGPYEDVPVEEYYIPLGKAEVRRAGGDVTVVTYGTLVDPALKAADMVSASVEVIDLQTLCPWDEEIVLRSVEKTGRLVIVHEAARSFGPGAEIAARVAEKALLSLEAPIVRIAGFDAHRPIGCFEDMVMIKAEQIMAGIEQVLEG